MAGGGGPLPTTEAGSIVKVAALELPSEVVTVMPVDPAVAMRLAGIAAVICEVERKVVEREVAPQWTVDEDVKLTPLMVSVKAAEPATISPGLRLLMVGVAAKTGKAESAASVAGKVAANHRARRGIFRMLSPSKRYERSSLGPHTRRGRGGIGREFEGVASSASAISLALVKDRQELRIHEITFVQLISSFQDNPVTKRPPHVIMGFEYSFGRCAGTSRRVPDACAFDGRGLPWIHSSYSKESCVRSFSAPSCLLPDFTFVSPFHCRSRRGAAAVGTLERPAFFH